MIPHPTHSLISKIIEYRLVRLFTTATDVTALGTRIWICGEKVPSIIEIMKDAGNCLCSSGIAMTWKTISANFFLVPISTWTTTIPNLQLATWSVGVTTSLDAKCDLFLRKSTDNDQRGFAYGCSLLCVSDGTYRKGIDMSFVKYFSTSVRAPDNRSFVKC